MAIDSQDSAGDVNIGTSILRRFVLTIDFPGHAVWLEASQTGGAAATN